MTDIGLTIAPKSDQLNSDDLISGPRTIKVTQVSLCSEPDQPVAINYDGDGGKPYKPCKSMRRVLVNVWGRDGQSYVGRSMTIYRDNDVVFGGVKVGGIRISHMSHIDKPVTMALTATRANRKPFTVQPLKVASEQQKPAASASGEDRVSAGVAKLIARIVAAPDFESLQAITAADDVVKQRGYLLKNREDLARKIEEAVKAKLAEYEAAGHADETSTPSDHDDIFPGDREAA